ncbi:hypothetical protein Tco_0579707, partial [Tanacetum coccineum]
EVSELVVVVFEVREDSMLEDDWLVQRRMVPQW